MKLYTVQELVTLSENYLASKGCKTPRLDAEILLAHVLGMDRLHLYLNLERPLEKDEVDAYRQLIGRRGKRVPVAYLTGKKEFYGREFEVNESVLIPRPETEILIDQAVSVLKTMPSPRILDMCTGSGVIAITLAHLVPQAHVLAVDISSEALAIAKRNADRLGVGDQLSFLQSDMFTSLPQQQFDLVCANPPYIPSDDWENLDQEVKLEPKIALDGGQDGLDYYRIIIAKAPLYLTVGGTLIMEIGWNQGQAVTALAQARGFVNCRIVPDYAGKDRVVVMQWL